MSEEKKQEIREGMEQHQEEAAKRELERQLTEATDELREAREEIYIMEKQAEEQASIMDQQRLENNHLRLEMEKAEKERDAALEKLTAADVLVKKWHKVASRRKVFAAVMIAVYVGASVVLATLAGADLCPVWPALISVGAAVAMAAATGWGE